jgi:hypothetical protein
MKLCLGRLHFVQSDYAAQASAGSWSNACGGYRCPSGAVIAMSRQPSSARSAAFFRAATAVSRRRVMEPEVSVAVIKNRIGDPMAGHRSVTQTDDEARRNYRLAKCKSDQAGAKQDETGHDHSDEVFGNEFITHGTPPIVRPCSNGTTVPLHSDPISSRVDVLTQHQRAAGQAALASPCDRHCPARQPANTTRTCGLPRVVQGPCGIPLAVPLLSTFATSSGRPGLSASTSRPMGRRKL